MASTPHRSVPDIEESDAPPESSGQRFGRLRRLAPALLPILLVVVLFGPHLIGVRSLSPADQLYQWEPWASQRPDDATLTHSAPFSDNFDGVFPQREQVVTRMRAGDWPLWNPLSSGGADLATSLGVSAAAPSNAVALITPGWYTPGLLKALELIGAWSFVFLFLRRVGTRRWPASIAGVIFALSGFQVVWVNWPHTRVSMFAAGILWAFDRLLERTTPDRIAVAALIVGSTILEGFPAVAAVGVGTAAIVLTFRLVQMSEGWLDALRRSAAAAAAAVLGAMLSAITVVPFALRLGSYGLDRKVTADSPLARGLGTLLAPNALGPAERYFGPLNYIEVVGFIGGAALLACATAGLVVLFSGRPSTKDLLLLLTVGAGSIMLLYSFGVEPIYDMFRGLPVLSTNLADRVKASALLLLALGAGLGLDRLMQPISARALRWAATAWTGALLAGGTLYLLTFVRDAPADLHSYIRGEVIRAIVLAAIATLAIVTMVHWSRLPRLRSGAIAVVALVVVVDAVSWILPYWPRSQPDEFYPETSSHEFLSDVLGEERFASLSLTFFPGTSTYYGLRNVGGHNFFDQRWAESLISAGALMRSPTFVTFEDPVSASSPVFDRMGVAYWADPAGVARCRGETAPTPLKHSDDGRSTSAFEVTGPGIRGVTFSTPRSLARGTSLVVRARTDDGKVLRGERTLNGDVGAGTSLTVVVPLLELHSGTIEMTLESSAPLGRLRDLTVCHAQNDGLVLSYANGAWIYRRTNALPRIRWAAHDKVIEDPTKRIAAIRAGDVDDDTIVLDKPTGLPTGGSGTVKVVDDSFDALDIDVDADGPGFLVVADPIQHGWVAEVDGRRTKILAADHSGGAVPITKGDHTVVLTYEPRGVKVGLLVSGVAAATVIALFGAAAYQRLRRRQQT
ncbi:MAG: YfhO family protein [Microthrixaceae bacterium]